MMRFFPICCCVHILHLIVQEDLNIVVKSIIEFEYIQGSQIRKPGFFRNVSDLKLHSRQGVRQDVPTGGIQHFS